MVSATSTSSECGTEYRLKVSRVSTTCSASCPAARAFHSPSGVRRYVCTCSGARSSSAKGAIALRQASAAGWSTSSSSVLSLCTMSGPSGAFIEPLSQPSRLPADHGRAQRALAEKPSFLKPVLESNVLPSVMSSTIPRIPRIVRPIAVQAVIGSAVTIPRRLSCPLEAMISRRAEGARTSATIAGMNPRPQVNSSTMDAIPHTSTTVALLDVRGPPYPYPAAPYPGPYAVGGPGGAPYGGGPYPGAPPWPCGGPYGDAGDPYGEP